MNKPRAKTARAFTDEQTKFIVDFYNDHFEIMFAPQYTVGIQVQRSRLLNQCVNEVNAAFGTQFTRNQIRAKMKQMKKFIKRQIGEQNATIDADDNDDDDDDLDDDFRPDFLSPAEESQMVQLNDRPAFVNVPASAPTLAPILPPRTSYPTQNQVQTTRVPMSAKRPRPNNVTASRRYNASANASISIMHDDDAVGSLKVLKKSVLLLQKQVYENELKLQADKKSAVDEYRRHIAEKRLKLRGFDLTAVPVEIPPGLDTAALEERL